MDKQKCKDCSSELVLIRQVHHNNDLVLLCFECSGCKCKSIIIAKESNNQLSLLVSLHLDKVGNLTRTWHIKRGG